MMSMQHTSNSQVTVAGQPLEEVSSFAYLGNLVDSHGRTDADVKESIDSANCLPEAQESLELQRDWKIHQIENF